MEENKALHGLVNRKKNLIPRSLSYWLYFKRHVLEKDDVRLEFQRVDLDLSGFKRLLWKLAHPLKYGPSFCRRRSGKTNQRNIQDLMLVVWKYYQSLLLSTLPIEVKRSAYGGLGLFLKSSRTLRPNATLCVGQLWGVVFEIPLDHHEQLEHRGYPSLYDTHIMGGPLSLVNHRCRAPLMFTQPRKLRLEEFEGISGVYLQNGTASPVTLDEGGEVLVDYTGCGESTFFGAECKCVGCLDKHDP